MTGRGVTESVVEQAALAWLESGGWQIAHGPEIAPDMPAAERRDYSEVVLAQHLHDALARLKPGLPAKVLFQVQTETYGTCAAERDGEAGQ